MTLPATKRCGACRETKPSSAFGRDRSRGDGLTWRCRDCGNAADRAKPKRPKAIKPRPACANCKHGRHGRWCIASLFGPWCPCGCRAVLGLAGPFELGDPTAPDGADQEVA
jgi:hypothetical protein